MHSGVSRQPQATKIGQNVLHVVQLKELAEDCHWARLVLLTARDWPGQLGCMDCDVSRNCRRDQLALLRRNSYLTFLKHFLHFNSHLELRPSKPQSTDSFESILK